MGLPKLIVEFVAGVSQFVFQGLDTNETRRGVIPKALGEIKG
jgi:hypothetical protein